MNRIYLPLFLLFFSLNSFATSINVLTLNVFAKPDIGQKKVTTQRMQAICNKIKNSSYDVVLLQELWMVRYRKMFNSCGYPYIMNQKNFTGTKDELDLGSGLLILSKFPILESYRYILVRPAGIKAFFHGENIAKKSLYLARIQVGGKNIWVANTHLVANYCENDEWYKCDSYTNTRRKQIESIARTLDVKAGNEPVIFGGDLNSGEKKIAHDSVWDEMQNLFPGYSQGDYDHSISTFSSANLFNRGLNDPGKIDHIFASDHFSILNPGLAMNETFKDAGGITRQYSDHYGWSANFTIP